MSAELPVVAFAERGEWEEFLAGQDLAGPGVWLKIAKKGSGIPSVTYAEALEGALCHGWIDGTRRGLDDRWFLQRFTPRRPRSKWSKVNRAAAERLIAAGRMGPGGLREVERARADGRWDAAYDAWGSATVPEDLRAALDAEPVVRERFARLDGRNRYAILYRVADAKRPETRARRIATFVAMLREGGTLY